MSARRPPAQPGLRIRLVLAPGFMIGPGKADLLQGIAETGSIAAAGRGMKMSYKRAWMLVEEMNATFRDALVDSTRGGPNGGGARLTEAGQTVLAQYRSLEATLVQEGAAQISTLHRMLRDISGQK